MRPSIGQVRPSIGHFDCAHRRAHRLRSERRIRETDPFSHKLAVALSGGVEARVRVAERRGSGEDVAGAAVPEIAHVKTELMTVGVLRGVTCRTLRPPERKAGASAASAPSSAAPSAATEEKVRRNTPAEPARCAESLTTAERLLSAAAKTRKGKIVEGLDVVGGKKAVGVGKLVLRAVVGAGVEVAGGAGGAAVAAYLHVPEQRFAEDDAGRRGRGRIDQGWAAPARAPFAGSLMPG